MLSCLVQDQGSNRPMGRFGKMTHPKESYCQWQDRSGLGYSLSNWVGKNHFVQAHFYPSGQFTLTFSNILSPSSRSKLLPLHLS